MRRAPGEKPTVIVRDTAYLPLHCNGNGNRDCQSHSPACPVKIEHDAAIWIAHWKSSPHHTIHCRSCREHFFSAQRRLL